MRTSSFSLSVKKRLTSVAGDRFGGLGVCLTYHRIAPAGYRPKPFDPNLSLYVGLEDFEEQMRYVAGAFRCIDVDELVSGLREGNLKEGSLLVTFDDGYRDNLELALPVLKKYRIPAVIYVTTDYIDQKIPALWWFAHEAVIRSRDQVEIVWKGQHLAWDTSTLDKKNHAFAELGGMFRAASPEERVAGIDSLRELTQVPPSEEIRCALSWEEIRVLDRDPLITIGAHTRTHSIMKQLDPGGLKREIVESKARLEKELGHPVMHFAYPFGGAEHAGEREFAAVRECGFESAVTTRPGRLRSFHGKHLHSLPRVGIGFGSGLENFIWKLSALGSLIRRPWGAWVAD